MSIQASAAATRIEFVDVDEGLAAYSLSSTLMLPADSGEGVQVWFRFTLYRAGRLHRNRSLHCPDHPHGRTGRRFHHRSALQRRERISDIRSLKAQPIDGDASLTAEMVSYYNDDEYVD